MSGSRGAKGSIKDRLISMLYRYRYNKKKLKEEDYTKENKERQLDYLDRLNTLKEKEDTKVLDSNDIRRLDAVKLEVNIKAQEVKKKSLQKSIKNVTLYRIPRGANFENIKVKSQNLNSDKVEIKKEVKKVKEEITILNEVNKFIKTSKENLNNIEKSVIEIKNDLKIKNQDVKIVEEKYKKLKREIEKLKLQYDTVKNKYDLSEFKILESIKLMDSISNYKSLASLNEIEMMVNVCKKEFDGIKKITVVSNEKTKTGNKIEDVKINQKNIKLKFIRDKSKIDGIKTFEDTVKEEIENQTKIVDEMYEKASFIKEDIIRTFEYVEKRKILSSIFRIATGMFTIPFTGKKIFGIALGSTMINKGLKELNRNIEKRERISINIKYEDLEKKLSETKDLIGYTNLVLADSIYQVKKLKKNFISEYSEYSNILPNFEETLVKLNDLENKLQNIHAKLLKTDKKVDKEKELNKQKMEKVYELNKKYQR